MGGRAPNETDSFIVTGLAPMTWTIPDTRSYSAPARAGGGGASLAFAPPAPILLPEFIVTPPPPPPVEVPLPVRTMIPSLLTTMATGLLALIFPQPTGPAEFDEAPTPPRLPPKPPAPTDPLEPPNWDELSEGGDESLLEPLRGPGLPVPAPEVELPLGERFFTVSPPKVHTRPAPIEVPFGFPWEMPSEYVFNPASPGPRPAPAPVRAPRVDRTPGQPDRLPLPGPGSRTRPDVLTAPDLPGVALPDLFGHPLGDPFTTPELPIRISPEIRTPGLPLPRVPTSDFDPVRDPINTAFPLDVPTLTEFGPQPLRPDADTCKCNKKKDKKPKRKERKPRDVCYRGTYVQHAKGISYRRLEQVPCAAAPGKRRSKPGAFPGASFLPGMNTEQSIDVLTDAYRKLSPIVRDYIKRKSAKPKKSAKKRNRRAKTKPGRTGATVPIYTTPF